jgi:hypothetical protein
MKTDPSPTDVTEFAEGPSDTPKGKRRFERGPPKEALTWKSRPQRAARMIAWRRANIPKLRGKASLLSVAWCLDGLCWKHGYAFVLNRTISEITRLQINHVQAALVELERTGVFVRASVYVEKGKTERRIWPSTQNLPTPRFGVPPHPEIRSRCHPEIWGPDSKRSVRTPNHGRISTTAAASKRDSEVRERRAAERAAAPRIPSRDEGTGIATPDRIPARRTANPPTTDRKETNYSAN